MKLRNVKRRICGIQAVRARQWTHERVYARRFVTCSDITAWETFPAYCARVMRIRDSEWRGGR